jgi:spore cortex formation protein SpoVR/YcgB (stage V sporulation)
MYAFLQTGLNKTKLSFTNITDFTDILSILESEAKLFTNALDKNGVNLLDNFYDIFVRQNNSEINKNKNRFKDYLSNINYESPEKIQPTVKATDTKTTLTPNAQTDSTNIDTPAQVRRLGLKTTDNPDMFTYNDAGAKNIFYYKNLGKSNPDVVFVHNVSIYEIMPKQIERGVNLGGASNFMTEVADMSVNFPTDLFINVVNNQRVPLAPDQYNTLKNIWEKRINILKQIKEKDGKLAFPEYGFGDPRTMPQELFVYLSKRLFEEFGYINPGSTMYNEIKKMVGVSQGISDEEILIQLELEEDPFKCS